MPSNSWPPRAKGTVPLEYHNRLVTGLRLTVASLRADIEDQRILVEELQANLDEIRGEVPEEKLE